MKAKVLVLGVLFLSLSLLCLQLEEKEKPSKIEQEIKAISDNETIAKFISILKVEDDGSMYHIWIIFLFGPKNHDEVQIWTDVVCKSSKFILDNNDVARNIEVWAIRVLGFSWEEGGVMFYGRTFYDRHTGKIEFKNINELKSKEEKKAVGLLE